MAEQRNVGKLDAVVRVVLGAACVAPLSVRAAAAATAPFIDHYTLFWGLLKASTVRVTSTATAIEVVQLWRIDNNWSERDIRDGYPDASPELLAEHVGQPIFPEGVHSIVTLTLRGEGDRTVVDMVQTGSPEFNKPIFEKHWQGLYFMPLQAGLTKPR